MTIIAQRGEEQILLAPALMTNGATRTANFDTIGADYATIRVALSSEAASAGEPPTISILSSDDTVVTNFATIIADRVEDISAAAKLVTYHVDQRAGNRFLRLSVTTAATDTNDDVTVSVTGTLTRMEIEPASAASMGNSTNEVAVIV